MKNSHKKSFESAVENAGNYEEWLEAAREFDNATGMDRWRLVDQSEDFDYTLVRARLDKLRRLRKQNNNSGLLFALNEGIHGNLGGMGNEALYYQAKSGTKKLIEDYINEISESLEFLASDAVDDISQESKLDFFDRAQHCFGSSALMLSGSGSLLFFHVGVVLALARENILPKIISGSSGGSLVASMLCTHTDDELEHIFDPDYFLTQEMRDKAMPDSLLSSLKPRLVTDEEVATIVEHLIPNLTFQEALEKTGRHLNITVASAEHVKTSRLLNAETSPNVYLREAVMASTAIPGFFSPVTLAAKNDEGERQPYLPSRQWVDGSLSGDLPTKRLARLYGVNHTIVSQTNPHIIPFVTDGKRKQDPVSLFKYASMDTARTWLNYNATLWRKPLSYSESLSKMTNALITVVNQNYTGDINILPERKYYNLTKWLGWLSEEDVTELMVAGDKATWPKIEMIRLQSKISRTLDTIVSEYKNSITQVENQTRVRKSG